jgi:hypothetical protein
MNMNHCIFHPLIFLIDSFVSYESLGAREYVRVWEHMLIDIRVVSSDSVCAAANLVLADI